MPMEPDHQNPNKCVEDQLQLVFAHGDQQLIDKWFTIGKACGL